MMRFLAMALVLITGSRLLASTSSENVDMNRELESLEWHTAGTYMLPDSHSSITMPERHFTILGTDAKKLFHLLENTDDPSLEAVVVENSSSNIIYFFNDNEGYVSTSDWAQFNSKQLLASIKKSTEKANKERHKDGVPGLHVLGWVEEPILDKETNTIYWAVEYETVGGEEFLFNAVALKLGRYGFEQIVWTGDMSQYKYKSRGEGLDVILKAHSFDPGYRYTDHTLGDKVADYGIASVIAATAGAAKVAHAVGFIALLKKAGGFIVAAAAALFYTLKKLFTRKKSPPPLLSN